MKAHDFFSEDTEPANFVAWFDYEPSDENITVNYFYFPLNESMKKMQINDYGHKASESIETFINRTIQKDQNMSTESFLQLKMPIPIGLQNNFLIKKMQQYRYKDRIQNDAVLFTIDGSSTIYWGFKAGSLTTMHASYCYSEHHYHQSCEQIIYPVINAILQQHTSENWKTTYKEMEAELQKDWETKMQGDILKQMERTKRIFAEKGIKLEWMEQYGY